MHRNPVTAVATIATLLLAAPVLGQTVSTLTGPFHASGDIAVVTWDGKDESGRPLAGGVYYYALRSGDGVSRDRVVLLR